MKPRKRTARRVRAVSQRRLLTRALVWLASALAAAAWAAVDYYASRQIEPAAPPPRDGGR